MKKPESIREAQKLFEKDLLAFAKLVNPKAVYGEVHEKIFKWLQNSSHDIRSHDGEFDSNQLVLLPRGHRKSHIMAVWACWWITKHPETVARTVEAKPSPLEHLSKRSSAVAEILTGKRKSTLVTAKSLQKMYNRG